MRVVEVYLLTLAVTRAIRSDDHRCRRQDNAIHILGLAPAASITKELIVFYEVQR
jgi:hypothetical protein